MGGVLRRRLRPGGTAVVRGDAALPPGAAGDLGLRLGPSPCEGRGRLGGGGHGSRRSEEHTSELQSLMRISYAVFCLKKKKKPERYIKHILVHRHTTIQLSPIARSKHR